MKTKRTPHAETRRKSREQIIQAARRVFATLGYEGSTARDIVRESGLAQGSFYKNFKDKQEVFEIILARIMDPLVPALRRARAQAETTYDFLFFAFDACRVLAEQDPETAAIIARNQTTFRDVFYYAGSRAQIRADLIADLEQGQKTGRFKRIDSEQLADVLIALGLDLVTNTALSPEGGVSRVTFLADLFEPALDAPERPALDAPER